MTRNEQEMAGSRQHLSTLYHT